MPDKGVKVIAQNRRARHDYFILETWEAGIELKGTEVKSIRLGKCSLKDCYAGVKDGEMFVYGMHISPYEKGSYFNTDPLRPKRLLMHKSEIRKLSGLVQRQGLPFCQPYLTCILRCRRRTRSSCRHISRTP